MNIAVDPFDALMEFTARPPLVFMRGQGSWLWDSAGKRYLDFIQGWAVNSFGHAPPLIANALTEQAQLLLTPSPAYHNAPSLELAKALATGPKLLLADESLGGLDDKEMDQAADMLRKIRDELGITIIWVEHIMGVLMRVVDRVIVLDHGEKIFEGKPKEAAVDPRVTEVYLGKGHDKTHDKAQA